MPYSGTCVDGPMDGIRLVLRRLDFIAVHKPSLRYWVYRGNDAEDTFTLDLTVTEDEAAAGLGGPDWDGARPWNLQVQKDMWAAGLEIVAVPNPWFAGPNMQAPDAGTPDESAEQEA